MYSKRIIYINLITSFIFKKQNNIKLTKNNNFQKFGDNPQINDINKNRKLTWYPIGLINDFNHKTPTKIVIRRVNYIVWKDGHSYYCLRDACSHQTEHINNNTISCPYRGYI